MTSVNRHPADDESPCEVEVGVSLTRRALLAVAVMATAVPTYADDTTAENADVQAFLDRWDAGWAAHDPQAIAALCTEDSVTVNRFGSVIYGRAGTEKVMTILHKNGGIFSQASFPRQQIANVRRLSSDLIIVQSQWQNPQVSADGKVHPETLDDMVVTYVLVRRGSGLQAAQIDLHNVTHMANPYPSSITHKQP